MDQFKNEGKLRISPVVVYRKTGDVREDEREAMIIRRIQGPGKLTRQESKLILGKDNAIELGFSGILKHQLHLAPGYVLCFSTNFDRNVMKEFGCNGLFVVTNPDQFSELLVGALSTRFPSVLSVHGAVTYDIERKDSEITVKELRQRGEKFRESVLSDYFVKLPKYQKEAEYRFMFLVESTKPLEDQTLELSTSEIAKCCNFPDPPLA